MTRDWRGLPADPPAPAPGQVPPGPPGYALGLSWLDQMRLVILPQALKRILPALAGQFISTIEDSAIVTAISIQKLTCQGMQLAVSTPFTFEVWLMVAVL